MIKDPIVEEVRKHREQRAAKLKFDIKAIIADAKKRQKTTKHKVVSFVQPKRKTA